MTDAIPTDAEARPGRVAFQGAPGAFSHEACAALRPWDVAVGFDTFTQPIGCLGETAGAKGQVHERLDLRPIVRPLQANFPCKGVIHGLR